MIERDPPAFFDVSCDFCAQGYEVIESESFLEVVAEIKRRGWRVFRHKGEWHHECSDCRTDGIAFE